VGSKDAADKLKKEMEKDLARGNLTLKKRTISRYPLLRDIPRNG
jgi:hypothetical protein